MGRSSPHPGAAGELILATLLLAACSSNTSPATQPEAESATGERPALPAPAREAVEKAAIADVDPETMTLAEIEQLLGPGVGCGFAYSAHSPPVLAVRASADPAAPARGVVKIHGRLVELRTRQAGSLEALAGGPVLVAGGMAFRIRPLGEPDEQGPRRESEADMEMRLEQGLRVGYRGTYRCDA